MNFLQLCQRLRQETGISDSGPSNVTSQTGDMKRLVDWVQDSWMRIQTLHRDWQFMWFEDSLTDTGSEVARPDAVGEFIYLSIGGRILQKVHHLDLALSDTVTSYAELPNKRIRFNKALDGAVVNYEAYRKPRYFQEGIEAPSMPERFHMIIVWRALLDYAIFDEAPELTQKGRLHYEQLLAELNQDQLPEFQVTGPLV